VPIQKEYKGHHHRHSHYGPAASFSEDMGPTATILACSRKGGQGGWEPLRYVLSYLSNDYCEDPSGRLPSRERIDGMRMHAPTLISEL
jgi:hypothetical protein